MVAVIVLIAAFVTLGLVVVIAAFAGKRRAGDQPSRAANRLLYTGIAIVCLAIGLGVPGLLMVQNADSAPEKAVGGVDLTAAQVNGRELFTRNCSNCHTLRASNAVGKTGPNLDELRPPEGLVLNAILVGRARGAGNMPAGLLTGDDAKDVASYVAAVAGR
jgi:mono/diheme cytochrome c family protein